MEAAPPLPPDGDVNTGPTYIVAIIVTTVIAVLITWLRMYVRIFMSRNPGWDDWTMFVASLIAVVTNAFLILAYVHGVGRHMVYVPKTNLQPAFMWLWAAEPTNLFAVYLVRLSICLFFIRLIPPKKIYLYTIWVTIALLTASDIFTSIYFFFECRPIKKVWNPHYPGECFSDGVKKGAIWLYQITSIYGDLVLLIIPTTLFWRLQVPLRTKIGLIIICSLGIFTNICAIVKTILLPTLFSTDPDKTWIIRDLCLWAPLELNIGMICGTIPALAPLFGLSPSKSPSRQRRYRRFSKHGSNSYELSDNSSRGHKSARPTFMGTEKSGTVVGVGAERPSSEERIIDGGGASGGPTQQPDPCVNDEQRLGAGLEGVAAGYGLGTTGNKGSGRDAIRGKVGGARDQFKSRDSTLPTRLENIHPGERGIRATYEVEVKNEAIDGFEGIDHVGGGGMGGAQKAHRWNVV